jgi:hypothetical protein
LPERYARALLQDQSERGPGPDLHRRRSEHIGGLERMPAVYAPAAGRTGVDVTATRARGARGSSSQHCETVCM